MTKMLERCWDLWADVNAVLWLATAAKLPRADGAPSRRSPLVMDVKL